MENNQETSAISAESAKNLFIEEMNKKAKQIGMDHSHFVEPAGFPSTIQQVMTTKDMLKMIIHASGYKELTKIWRNKSYTMNISGNNERELTIHTTVTSPMIEEEYTIFGGKTGEIWGTGEIDGYHMALITSAPNGRRFVAAIRGASTSERREIDLKMVLDNAKLLLDNPNAPINHIISESAAVCLMPYDNSASYKNEDLPLLFSKEADVPGHPASVTKVMNAITALECLTNLDKKIVIQQSDITSGMGDYFIAGDTITLKDALYGMMLPSSNTCATAVARIAGEKIYKETIK